MCWLIVLLAIPSVLAGIPQTEGAALSARAREDLRFRLEMLFNEADLAIRNRQVDLSDLSRMARDAETLRLYERFPRGEDLPQLERTLGELGALDGIELKSVSVAKRAAEPAPAPSEVLSDGARFRLREAQLVQGIDLTLRVRGKRDAVLRWIQSWPKRHLRWAEPRGRPRDLGRGEFMVPARTYRFRAQEFPRIVLRDPIELLPVSARKNPEAFARAEPGLWKLMTQTRAILDTARPLLETRRRLLTERARMEFYLSKVLPAERR